MTLPLEMKNKDVVIVDDIISTGHTIAEAAKQAHKLGAKNITAIAVHGLLVENALKTMKKAGVRKVLTTNCIDNLTSKIDVTPILLDALRKEK